MTIKTTTEGATIIVSHKDYKFKLVVKKHHNKTSGAMIEPQIIANMDKEFTGENKFLDTEIRKLSISTDDQELMQPKRYNVMKANEKRLSVFYTEWFKYFSDVYKTYIIRLNERRKMVNSLLKEAESIGCGTVTINSDNITIKHGGNELKFQEFGSPKLKISHPIKKEKRIEIFKLLAK